jgi:ATP-binding cassette subfamily B protein
MKSSASSARPEAEKRRSPADLRFFDPQEGQVLLGGVDVRRISKEELMRHVAYVFQDSRLLKRSIADNLRIAKPDAPR